VKRHGAASCAISIFVLLTSTLALRGAGSLFAATRYASDPLPCPLLPDVITTQPAALDAAHVQSRVVVTVIVPAAPLAGAICIEFAALTSHFEIDGDVNETEEDPQPAVKEAASAAASAIV
jgi:hypothetical protein